MSRCARSPHTTPLLAAATAALLATLLPAPALAQDADGSEDGDWDVTLARGETREIDFETDEGTWMSVDISPDGRWIVFDLLAHVYRVPSEGGQAESLTQATGVAVNYHPRFSPDGTRIAFISDRGGQNNLWVMDADGSNARQVQSSMTTRVTMPEWTADGEYILVAQGGGIWMYHQDGGTGFEVVSSDGGSASWPSVSEDGRYLYYHVRTPGQTVPWALDDIEAGLINDELVRDALQGTMNIRRMELKTGDITQVTSGEPSRQYRLSGGGGFSGEISPDGGQMAFARRLPDATIEWKGHEFGPSTALWLRDLETGAERIVMDPITQDMSEGMKTIRVLPGYAWAPDGASIVIAQGGKLRRLDVASGEVATIPFTARVHRVISEQAYQAFRIDDGSVPITYTRWQSGSPDGARLAFAAAGRIWVMDLPDGTPRRLTADTGKRFEYSPSWSPDSRSIAYTTVDEDGTGHVMRISADGGNPRQVSDEAGSTPIRSGARTARRFWSAGVRGPRCATVRWRTIRGTTWSSSRQRGLEGARKPGTKRAWAPARTSCAYPATRFPRGPSSCADRSGPTDGSTTGQWATPRDSVRSRAMAATHTHIWCCRTPMKSRSRLTGATPPSTRGTTRTWCRSRAGRRGLAARSRLPRRTGSSPCGSSADRAASSPGGATPTQSSSGARPATTRTTWRPRPPTPLRSRWMSRAARSAWAPSPSPGRASSLSTTARSSTTAHSWPPTAASPA